MNLCEKHVSFYVHERNSPTVTPALLGPDVTGEKRLGTIGKVSYHLGWFVTAMEAMHHTVPTEGYRKPIALSKYP